MSTYTMGVLGGMGPKSTSYFLDEVFNHTEASCDQDHIDLICLNHSTIPDRTKSIQNNDTKEINDLIQADIKILENLNVKFISVPCNTVFFILNNLKQNTHLEILSIVEEAVKKVSSTDSVKSVCILGTEGTKQAKIYDTAFQSSNIQCLYPNKEIQTEINKIIYDCVKESKCQTSFSQLEKTIHAAKETTGANIVLLACTELSYARKGKNLPNNCIDTLDCLVESSISKAGKVYKS